MSPSRWEMIQSSVWTGHDLSGHINNVSHQQSGQNYLTDVAWPNPHITNRFKTTIRFQGLNVNIQCWKVYLWVCPGSFYRPAQQHAIWLQNGNSGKTIMSIINTSPTNRRREPWPQAAAGSPYESEPTWLSLLCHWALYTMICLWLLGNARQLHWQEAQHFCLKSESITEGFERSLRNQGRPLARWKRD